MSDFSVRLNCKNLDLPPVSLRFLRDKDGGTAAVATAAEWCDGAYKYWQDQHAVKELKIHPDLQMRVSPLQAAAHLHRLAERPLMPMCPPALQSGSGGRFALCPLCRRFKIPDQSHLRRIIQ